MKKICFLILLLVAPMVYAQTTREDLQKDKIRMLANYAPYGKPSMKQTPAPKGYKPFYISHYARHGSRHLISNSAYHYLIPLMEKAEKEDQLTDLGKTMLERARKGYAHAKGKGGELSLLGGKQHEQTARRMYKKYPQVFRKGNIVTAYASYVDRSRQSMEHFCAELRRMNPKLQISEYSGKEYSYFVRPGHDSIGYESGSKAVKRRAERMEDSLKHTVNISDRIFKNPKFVTDNKKKHYLVAHSFHEIYKSMYSLPEVGLDFNVFTDDELFTYFKMFNINWMERTYVIPGEPPFYKRAYATLKNMISLADEAIRQGRDGATLRFGHDTFVMPLAYVLGMDGCADFSPREEDWEESYKYFVAADIVPMAANIQMIFYKNKKGGDILVKFLLQEKEKHVPVKTDMWPYYRWSDVKDYYMNLMEKVSPIEYVNPDKPTTPNDKEINT